MGKGGEWKTVGFDDISSKETYSYEPHSPVKSKAFPWLFCKHCGLLYLNNKFTKWSIRMGCNNIYHSDYIRMRKGN